MRVDRGELRVGVISAETKLGDKFQENKHFKVKTTVIPRDSSRPGEEPHQVSGNNSGLRQTRVIEPL